MEGEPSDFYSVISTTGMFQIEVNLSDSESDFVFGFLNNHTLEACIVFY